MANHPNHPRAPLSSRNPEVWRYISRAALTEQGIRIIIKEIIDCTPRSMKAKTIYESFASAYHEYKEENPHCMN